MINLGDAVLTFRGDMAALDSALETAQAGTAAAMDAITTAAMDAGSALGDLGATAGGAFSGMAGEAQDAGGALTVLGDTAGQAMAVIGDSAHEATANAEAAFAGVNGGVEGMTEKLRQAGEKMAEFGKQIMDVLKESITHVADTGDEINDMSKKIGFSTENVSKWTFALKQSGGDMGTLQTAVRGLAMNIDQELTTATKSQAEAQDKANDIQHKMNDEIVKYNSSSNKTNEQYIALQQSIARQSMALQDLGGDTMASAGAFDKLGIQVQNLRGMNPEQQFMAVAMAVAKIPDPMERAATAQQIFGRAGMELLPVLSEGEEGIRKMFDEAERAGAVFSAAEAAMGDEFNDAIGALQASFMGVEKELAVALIPDIIRLIEYTKDVVIGIKDWAQENPNLSKTLAEVTAGVGGFMLVGGSLLQTLPGLQIAVGWLASGFTWVATAVAGVAAAIELPIAAIVAGAVIIGVAAYEIIANWEDLPGFFSDVGERIATTARSIGQAIYESDIARGIASSVENWVAYSAEKLGEFVGWLAGNWLQAFTDPVAFIAEVWGSLVDTFYWLWDNIGAAFNWTMDNVILPAYEKMKEIYNWISGVFMSGFDQGAAIAQGATPALPGAADGVTVTQAGWGWVGEKGPERVYLPTGARVFPADQSAAMGGGANVTITIGSVSLPNRAAIQEFNRGLGTEVARRMSARGLQPRLA